MVCVGISPHLPRHQFSAKNHCRILCQRNMEGPCSQDKGMRGREGPGGRRGFWSSGLGEGQRLFSAKKSLGSSQEERHGGRAEGTRAPSLPPPFLTTGTETAGRSFNFLLHWEGAFNQILN